VKVGEELNQSGAAEEVRIEGKRAGGEDRAILHEDEGQEPL